MCRPTSEPESFAEPQSLKFTNGMLKLKYVLLDAPEAQCPELLSALMMVLICKF